MVICPSAVCDLPARALQENGEEGWECPRQPPSNLFVGEKLGPSDMQQQIMVRAPVAAGAIRLGKASIAGRALSQRLVRQFYNRSYIRQPIYSQI